MKYLLHASLCLSFLFASGQNLYLESQEIVDRGELEAVNQFRVGDHTKTHVYERIQDKKGPTTNTLFLVSFTDKPSYLQELEGGRHKLSIIKSSVDLRLETFRKDLSNLSRSNTVANDAPEIIKEYHKVYFGALVSMTSAHAELVKKLSYIREVRPQRQYSINLNQSVPLIRADEYWETYNKRGEGITVGIMDTGIDYMHSALGGGYGEDFKVVGGYDFVNEDNDPMDDHSHGTHVAGIVAADGENLVGVAPSATLVALKVLDEYGYGFETDILEAIEWSLDPNGDNDRSDKLDVVNMSLGATALPDDPMAQAVDIAVSLGVVYCISAGNSYNHFTVSSPGIARNAITVGASDLYDNRAYFSSRGPTRFDYLIKPDILAPGDPIRSAMLNDEYDYQSGTSMAAPHVAGLAALLLELNGDWTPEMVKSAMTAGAKSINESVLEEGNGRIDAINSSEVTSFIAPTNLSFGLNEIMKSKWDTTVAITLTNHSNVEQNYSVSISTLPEGVTLEPAMNDLVIAPRDTVTIEFELQIDNEIFQSPDNQAFSTEGIVSIFGTRDSFRIPFAFLSAAKLVLNFEEWEELDYFLIFNDDTYYDSRSLHVLDNRTELLIKDGSYDMLLTRNITETIIVKEDVQVESYANIDISWKDAKNKILLRANNKQGEPLLPDSTSNLSMLIAGSGFSSAWGYFKVPFDTVYVSDISDDYSLSFSTIVGTPYTPADSIIYNLNFGSISDVSEDHILEISTDEMIATNLDFELFGSDSAVSTLFNVSYAFDENENFYQLGGYGSLVTGFESGNWHLKVYSTPQTFDQFGNKYGLYFFFADGDYYVGQSEDAIELFNFSNIEGRAGSVFGKEPAPYNAMVEDGATLKLGAGLLSPFHDTHRWYITGLQGPYNEKIGTENEPFYRYSETQVMFLGNQEVSWSDSSINYEFHLFNEDEVDMSKPHGPILRGLQLLNDEQKLITRITAREASVKFWVFVEEEAAGLVSHLYLRMHGDTEYLELETDRIALSESLAEFSSLLPDLPIGLYDVLIKSKSGSDSVTWKLEPGFAVSEDILSQEPSDEIFQLFPIPSDGIFQLKTDRTVQLDAELYNLNGRKVGIYSMSPIKQHEYRLKVEDLNAGIYFVKITDNSGITYHKIIIN